MYVLVVNVFRVIDERVVWVPPQLAMYKFFVSCTGWVVRFCFIFLRSVQEQRFLGSKSTQDDENDAGKWRLSCTTSFVLRQEGHTTTRMLQGCVSSAFWKRWVVRLGFRRGVYR